MWHVVRSSSALLALGIVGLGFPSLSRADITHTVSRGHTIEAIAHRYRVSVKAIVDANHLKDPGHLRIGDTLTIPGVQKQEVKDTQGKDSQNAKVKGKKDTKPVTYAMRAKTPGVVHATRLATSEDFTIRANDRRGHSSPTALKSFEKMMRSGGGQTHPVDSRLMSLITIVSNHFGSRKLEIVSGYRPYTPTQYTAHSNHNVGRAIDFRVAGVPNEVLRDFCRTLKNVGVGYYPNSTFVHLDVRDSSAFWIDYSKPGEPPRYNSPNVDADEGTSDVTDESHGSDMDSDDDDEEESTPPSTNPAPPPAPTSNPVPSAAPTAPTTTPFIGGGSIWTPRGKSPEER